MRGTLGTAKPAGTTPLAGGGTEFRVWAPSSARVQLLLEAGVGHPAQTIVELQPEGGGYHGVEVPAAIHGTRYRYRLKGGAVAPDPRSRHQPEGPDGPSEVCDPGRFSWTDQNWPGLRSRTPVLYELHAGTFTPEGTWAAARARLGELHELGIDGIELMPVADFAGRFGWGYDGACLFAPSHLYGTPDDLRAFIDQAHALGLGVILDVVYNHWGVGAGYLERYSPDYISRRHASEWGPAPNFDGANCGPVRQFFIDNVILWIRDFHFDGLRFDATQQIFDTSKPHILAELAAAARAAAGSRRLYLVAENEPQDSRLAAPVAAGGFGLDAVWNEDFQRTATVALTGRAEAYYTDSRGSAQEFVSTLRHGPLYQGQRSRWQRQPRGRPGLGLSPAQWVVFLENHDQIANTLRGERLHGRTDRASLRAATALLLLAPCGVLLFQGQEFAASSPFTYFADHHGELGRAVAAGRRKFLSQFPSIAVAEAESPGDPADARAFAACKLKPEERALQQAWWRLHRDLLRWRREDGPITHPDRCEGAVLGPGALVQRYFSARWGDRLLLVNLGSDVRFEPAPEPLLAPPEGHRWRLSWSSDRPSYGGQGALARPTDGGWFIPGRLAALFCPDDASS